MQEGCRSGKAGRYGRYMYIDTYNTSTTSSHVQRLFTKMQRRLANQFIFESKFQTSQPCHLLSYLGRDGENRMRKSLPGTKSQRKQ